MPDEKRIFATVQPQAWVFDDAVDSDFAFEIDVTEQVLAMPREVALAIRDNCEESDELWLTHPEYNDSRHSEHRGPFYVTVADAIAEYYGVAEDDDELIARGSAALWRLLADDQEARDA